MDEYGLNVWMNRKEKKENGNEKREKEKKYQIFQWHCGFTALASDYYYYLDFH